MFQSFYMALTAAQNADIHYKYISEPTALDVMVDGFCYTDLIFYTMLNSQEPDKEL